MQVNSPLRNSMGQAIYAGLYGLAATNTVCEFWAGPRPASPGAPATGMLLATGVGDIIGFNWDGGSFSWQGFVAPVIVSTPGLIKWVRFKTGEGDAVLDIDVAASGAQNIICADASVFSGSVLDIPSLVIQFPLIYPQA